jgi:hypothetical protein
MFSWWGCSSLNFPLCCGYFSSLADKPVYISSKYKAHQDNKEERNAHSTLRGGCKKFNEVCQHWLQV